MICFSYVEMGILENTGAFYTWFVVLNDYGFKPWILWELANIVGTPPKFGDVYNPMAGPCKGNSICEAGGEMWIINQQTNTDNWIDLRLFWHQFDPIDWTYCWFSDGQYSKWFYVS